MRHQWGNKIARKDRSLTYTSGHPIDRARTESVRLSFVPYYLGLNPHSCCSARVVPAFDSPTPFRLLFRNEVDVYPACSHHFNSLLPTRGPQVSTARNGKTYPSVSQAHSIQIQYTVIFIQF